MPTPASATSTDQTPADPARQDPPRGERRRGRKNRPQAVLTVRRTEQLGAHLIRVVVGGDGFAQFHDNDCTDKYVKIFFADPALELTPPYDLDALRDQLDPEDLPVTRTYTVRAVDAEAQELTLDFVVHGDKGLAGPWARAARPGDRVALRGAGGGYAPDPAAARHLFVGDDTAVPAIASALEALPADARGLALIEVDGPDDELDLDHPAGVQVRWLHRDGETPGSRSLLPDAVRAWDWPDGRVQVFAHGERESMKALRAIFAEREVPRSDLSLSGYWAYGRDEQHFQAEKREPIGKIFPD